MPGLSVCWLTHISPLECLFALKILSRIYLAGNGGQTICGFFSEIALLRISSTPSVEIHMYTCISHFPVESAHEHYRIYHVVAPRILHFSAFIYYMHHQCTYMCVSHSLTTMYVTHGFTCIYMLRNIIFGQCFCYILDRIKLLMKHRSDSS